MKMKKAAALVCAAGMVMPAGLVAGAEEAQEPVSITWYRLGSQVNEDEKMVEDAINAYIEPLIGVHVNVLNSQENTELTLALAAGDDIDLWWDANWSNLNTLSTNGSTYDLADVIDNYPELKASIQEHIWESCKNQEGNLYYVPIYKEAGEGYSYTIPTAMVEKYGWDLSTVHELADLEPMLADMYADGVEYAFVKTNTYSCNMQMDTFARLTTYANDFACIRRDDPTKVVSYIDTEEFEAYCKLMHSWFENGYINDIEATENLSTDQLSELASEGNLGFVQWVTTPDGKANASSRYGVDMEIVPITENYIAAGSAAGSVYCVNAKTEKLDAVMKFLQLLSTDETLANLALYGIEGEHYNLVDGRVELIPDSGYAYGGAWCVCSANAPTLKVGESDDKKEQYTEFNNSLVTCVTSGFVFDQTNIETEVTAMKGVFSEYRDLLERGVYDPDEYLPKLREGLKEAGLEKAIADVQAQWDAFLASK